MAANKRTTMSIRSQESAASSSDYRLSILYDSNDSSNRQTTSIRSNGSDSGDLRLNPKRKVKLFNNSGDSNRMLAPSNFLTPVDEFPNRKRSRKRDVNNDSKRMFKDMFTVPDYIGCCGLESLGSREHHKMPPKRMKWWQVTLFLLNDINEAWLMLFSVIVLGMNGWILGMLLLVGMWPVNLYVAHLLWRCRNLFPGAISIGDLVYYLSHSCWAMYITFIIVNLTIAFNLAVNIIVAGSTIYWLSGFTSERCFVVFLACVCFILLPLTQLRTMHSLTIINGINLICLLCFLGIYLYFLARNGPDIGAVTRLGPNVEVWQSFFVIDKDAQVQASPLVGLEIMLTAYHYQLLILEIMAEMKDPREFPKANYWCTPVVLLVTLSSAAFRYYYQGELRDLALVMPFDVIASVFDQSKSVLAYFGMVCFTIKMLGSCLIRSVILTRFMQLLIHPQSANVRTWRSRLEWAGISVFVLVVVYFLSIAMSVVLTMTTVTTTLTIITAIILPVILYILAKRQTKQLKSIRIYDWVLMMALILFTTGILVAYFTRLGLTNRNMDFSDQQSNYTRHEFNLMTDCRSF